MSKLLKKNNKHKNQSQNLSQLHLNIIKNGMKDWTAMRVDAVLLLATNHPSNIVWINLQFKILFPKNYQTS